MNRRDFIKAASGAAGGTAAAGAAASAGAQESPNGTANNTTGGNVTAPGNATGGNTTGGNATGNQTGGGGGGGGGATKTVTLVDYAFEGATEQPLVIAPGTTVEFVWDTGNHNIVVESQPDGSSWQGHEPIEDSGFTHSHTFQTTGTYEFYCQPHKSLGMTGTINVQEGGASAGGASEEVDPEHMGVPFQAHFVGIATLVMMVVSVIYTFFLLKYGESPHAKGGN